MFGYKYEFSLTAKHPWSHIKLHKHTQYYHFVWGKISFQWARVEHCEECSIETDLGETLCDECYQHNYCECGTRLEDSYGSPGDGFCVRCR